jgi:hypothetical protein
LLIVVKNDFYPPSTYNSFTTRIIFSCDSFVVFVGSPPASTACTTKPGTRRQRSAANPTPPSGEQLPEAESTADKTKTKAAKTSQPQQDELTDKEQPPAAESTVHKTPTKAAKTTQPSADVAQSSHSTPVKQLLPKEARKTITTPGKTSPRSIARDAEQEALGRYCSARIIFCAQFTILLSTISDCLVHYS